MKAPKHLTVATRRWVGSVLERYELQEHHFKLLLLAAESWDRANQAAAVIREHGVSYTDRFGAPRSRPEVAVEHNAKIAFARLVRELGLDKAEAPAGGGMQPRRANDANWTPPSF
jgi:phage terminase small subunit